MKMVQSFGITPARLGGGMWMEVRVTDLGATPDLVIRETISQEAVYRGVPIDRVIYGLRRRLEIAIGDRLFEGLVP